MNKQLIAYCGINCNECPVFIASQNDDYEIKVELAKEFSNEKCTFGPEDISCVGCYEVDLENSKMCSACKVKACVVDKEVENCGYCEEYACELIDSYFSKGSEERNRLDQMKMK